MSENDTQKITLEPEIEWIETENEDEFRSQIFQMDDREELLVPVPEWKRKILLKRLTGTVRAEFISFRANLTEHYGGKPEFWKQLWFELVRVGCVHPKTRRPVFKLADRDTFLGEHDGGVIQMLGETVAIFSQLDGSVIEQAKKNLQPIQSSTTTTPLQNDSNAST
jgi:hypothetical protein